LRTECSVPQYSSWEQNVPHHITVLLRTKCSSSWERNVPHYITVPEIEFCAPHNNTEEFNHIDVPGNVIFSTVPYHITATAMLIT